MGPASEFSKKDAKRVAKLTSRHADVFQPGEVIVALVMAVDSSKAKHAAGDIRAQVGGSYSQFPASKSGYHVALTQDRVLVFDGKGKELLSEGPRAAMSLATLPHASGQTSLIFTSGNEHLSVTAEQSSDDTVDAFRLAFTQSAPAPASSAPASAPPSSAPASVAPSTPPSPAQSASPAVKASSDPVVSEPLPSRSPGNSPQPNPLPPLSTSNLASAAATPPPMPAAPEPTPAASTPPPLPTAPAPAAAATPPPLPTANAPAAAATPPPLPTANAPAAAATPPPLPTAATPPPLPTASAPVAPSAG